MKKTLEIDPAVVKEKTPEPAFRIPRCMNTQHPDNVLSPFFTENSEMGGEDETIEAYYAFSHLGCREQMWDCEGKEVDNYVVKKLLTKYEAFFKENRLGRDFFLTLRVPNPTVEQSEAKILLETLESIPRSFDAAKLFYGNGDVPPIFEVILPMTASALDIDRIYRYYSDFVIGKEKQSFRKGDITIAEWIGEFHPKRVNVIPLFEDIEHMMNAHEITRTFLEDKDVPYQRVFLARSDPAMNYGMISAVLMNKIALVRLEKLSQDLGIPIYPIIGAGSVPFRGNLRPETIDRVVAEYPSAATFTIQSAFKYDNPPDIVHDSIRALNAQKVGPAHRIDEERCQDIIRRYGPEYTRQIIELAPVVNKLAKYVPSRRKRKLHIGLFGYARNVKGVSLPRVITFTSVLYSIGLPPEILGLNALTREDIRFLKETYVNFEADMQDALRYFNPDNPYVPKEVVKKLSEFDFKTDERHKEITDAAVAALKNNRLDSMGEYVLRSGSLRKFLG